MLKVIDSVVEGILATSIAPPPTDGPDVITGDDQDETLSGGKGDDLIDGGDGNDIIRAGAGNDTIVGSEGDDRINGAGGFDTVTYLGGIDDYDISMTFNGRTIVTSSGPVADVGMDFLRNVEALYFAADDYTLYLDGRNNDVLSRDDEFSIGEDDTLSFSMADLLLNDQEFDGDRLRITEFDVQSAGGGSITRDGDTFTYNPLGNFGDLNDGETAIDTFTYTVGDGNGGATTATVNVTINGTSDAPIDARINEFHYDNASSDTGEFIEIRVAVGTDVSGLLLEFYNDAGEIYNSETFSTLNPTCEDAYEYYTVALPANGIQNGPADGFALSNNGALIEFLSYEGTVTAIEGDAAIGVTSTDIGVAESSSTPAGFSLQRNDDGSWREEGPETPGAENVAPLAQIVVTEVMQNPSAVSDGSGEWFEIYNASGYDVDISGWTVADNDTDSFTISSDAPLIIADGSYLVLGNNADTASNGGVSVAYEYSGMFLSNSSDELVLTDTLDREVDRVEWDDGATFPDPNGSSMALLDPSLDNNDGANWQQSTQAFGDGDFGTPGARNVEPSDVLVINEIMQNPSAVLDSSGEWFELYNPGATDIDINGWTVADNDNDSHVIDNGGPLIVSAGGYIVLGINADSATNGGVNVDYEYSGISLTNGADELVLFNADTTEVDRVEWDGGPLFPDPSGASMSLDDSDSDNNNGSNWSTASDTFGDGDFGTPGSINNEDTGSGGDPTAMLISAIQGSGAATPVSGELVAVTAIVTYLTEDGFFLQEEDADADADAQTSEGIFVFTAGNDLPSLGDLVTVTGTVTEFFDMTQISGDYTIEVVSSGNPLPLETLISLGPDELNNFEAVEGMRIALESATDEPLTIIENFNFDRFGELVVSAGVQTQATQLFDAQTELAEIQALSAQNQNNRLGIDDGLSQQNPTSFAYIENLSAGDDGDGILSSGDTFTSDGPTVRLGTEINPGGATGVMTYAFGEFKLLVEGQLGLDPNTNEGARDATPDDVGGTLQVGAFNVLNYFTTLSGEGTSGPNNLSPRGASSAEDLERQTDKLVEAMSTSGVDVFAIQEVENNGFDGASAIGTLSSALNTASSGATAFSVVDPTGGTDTFIGTDAITTGIVYDANLVTLVDSDVVVFSESSAAGTLAAAEALSMLIGGSNPVGDVQRNRPATVATFEDILSGEEFTVVSVHFKSKGSSGLETLSNNAQSLLDNPSSGLSDTERADIEAALATFQADPNFDQGNGQGFWNAVRADAAGEVYDFLTNDYGGSGVTDYVVLGDYNAYSQEDPTQVLTDQADTVDLLAQYVGEDAYSFVFDGQRGALDQAVASTGLADNVTGLTEWHINADEPDLLNYNSAFNDPGFYNDDLFASSDHDPVILGLEFITDPLAVV
ncbi:MAG: ExeM/NucH family extracellular endonuclease [Aliishimia sp.]